MTYKMINKDKVRKLDMDHLGEIPKNKDRYIPRELKILVGFLSSSRNMGALTLISRVLLSIRKNILTFYLIITSLVLLKLNIDINKL